MTLILENLQRPPIIMTIIVQFVHFFTLITCTMIVIHLVTVGTSLLHNSWCCGTKILKTTVKARGITAILCYIRLQKILQLFKFFGKTTFVF